MTRNETLFVLAVRAFVFSLFYLVMGVALARPEVEVLKKIGKRTQKVMKIPGIGSALWIANNYRVNPEETNLRSIADDTMDGFTMGNETADCDTVQCHEFTKQCSENLGYAKDIPPGDVVYDSNFKVCVTDFFMPAPDKEMRKALAEKCRMSPTGPSGPRASMFGCPLDVQTRYRQDSNLDRLLSKASPAVRNLQCSNNTAEVQIVQKEKTYANLKLIFDSKGQVEKVVSATSDKGEVDYLLYRDGKPQLLQHCDKNRHCRNDEMEKVRKTKLYFWRDSRLHKLVGDSSGGVPRESYEWARKVEQLTSLQTVAIRECCGDQKCQAFFSQRAGAFEAARAGAKSNGAK